MIVYSHNTARETTGAAAQKESQQAAHSKPKRKTDHPGQSNLTSPKTEMTARGLFSSFELQVVSASSELHLLSHLPFTASSL
jgi:hypothetical protein